MPWGVAAMLEPVTNVPADSDTPSQSAIDADRKSMQGSGGTHQLIETTATPAMAAWTELLRVQMPLTAAMGVVVREADLAHVRVAAPFGPNQNHADTAFGGSLSVMGIVAGWLLVQVRAQAAWGEGIEVVIRESQSRFIRPVVGELVAEAAWPKADPWANLAQAFDRTGSCAVEVRSEIRNTKGKIAVVHDATYVVSKKTEKP